MKTNIDAARVARKGLSRALISHGGNVFRDFIDIFDLTLTREELR